MYLKLNGLFNTYYYYYCIFYSYFIIFIIYYIISYFIFKLFPQIINSLVLIDQRRNVISIEIIINYFSIIIIEIDIVSLIKSRKINFRNRFVEINIFISSNFSLGKK